jgi:hypothetical protein
MNKQNILGNEPNDVTHTDADGVKYSYLGENNYAVWMDKETVPYWREMPFNNIECASYLRSLEDVERIVELEKELLLDTKNSVATELLNIMEKDNVENFSIQIFKVDSGLKRDLQVTCEYLDSVSVSETITELRNEKAELEKKLTCKFTSYKTEPAESVAGMAIRQLGNESRWVDIAWLNSLKFPDIGPNDYYPVGTILIVPESK